MAIDNDPILGHWYQHLDKGHKFTVVAIDEEKRLVEIQHFDGDLEEIELESWYEMEIEQVEAPEDWTGPMDELENEDLLGYTETGMAEDDWREPLRELSRTSEAWENRDPDDDALDEDYLREDVWDEDN